MSDRYPVFQTVFQDRLAELTRVIETCEARGLRPALLELPLNLEVVGDDFDEALKTYRQACLAWPKSTASRISASSRASA